MRRSLVFIAAILAAVLAFGGSAMAARIYAPAYGSTGLEPERISGFDRAADGSLTPIPGSPFAAYPGPSFEVAGLVGLAFTPDGSKAVSSFLFYGGVQGYSVSSGGAISPTNAVTTNQSEGAAVSPDGRFAYEATREYPPGSGTEGIHAFSIAPDGSVTDVGTTYEPTVSFGEIALSPDGRLAFATAIDGVHRFAVNGDGSLTSLGTTASSPRWLTVSPDGRFLFVGVDASPARVDSYAIGADGSLTPRGSALTGSNSVDLFAVAPDGGHLYIPDSNTETIVTAAVAEDGNLSVVNTIETPTMEPFSAAVSPDGRFLYWAHEGDSEGIVSTAIGSDGLPGKTPLGEVAFKSAEPTRLVFQPAPAPAAGVKVQPAAPGEATRFDAGSSTNAAHYNWDFGDGVSLPDGGPEPQHSYAKAGVYRVTLSVTDAQGCGTTQIYTGQSTTCPGSPAASTTVTADTLPVLSGLKSVNKKFAPKGRKPKVKKSKIGTKFAFKLNEPAKVDLEIERKLPGRRVGAKCKKATRVNANGKKCTLLKQLGSLEAKGVPGANKIAFNGKLKGKPLVAGNYRASATATDSAGGRSAARIAGFKVLGATAAG